MYSNVTRLKAIDANLRKYTIYVYIYIAMSILRVTKIAFIFVKY